MRNFLYARITNKSEGVGAEYIHKLPLAENVISRLK